MSKKDLAKQGTQAMTSQRESFIEKGDVTGTEGITADELRLPRLSFAQGLSPQMMPNDPVYIQGLTLFQMFNDITQEIYGMGPMEFVPVRRDVKYIQFRPREEGGGVLDLNVAPNDPRTRWTVEDGERKPPKATRFVEFVVLLMKEDAAPQPIVLSIKPTNKLSRKAEEFLTGRIKLTGKPIYAGLYTVSSYADKNDKGTFAVPVIKTVCLLDDPNVDDDTWEKHKLIYTFAQDFERSIRGKDYSVQREHPDVDATVDAETVERPEM